MDDAIPREELADELARHLEFLRRMSRALVRDEQVAEDVVQETLLAALARRPEPEVGLRPWLGSVLRRRVLLYFRTEQRRLAREGLLQRDLRDSTAGGQADEAERALMSLERSTALGREVAALDEPYRTVVLLRFYEGLQPKDIALRMQRPVTTVNTQLQRGLQQLRMKLDKSHGGRREWVCALLPLALDGSDGWWPSSVSGVAGVSKGAVTVAFAVLFSAALGVWLPSFWSGQPSKDDRAGQVSRHAPSAGVGADAHSAEDELLESTSSRALTALRVQSSTSSSSAMPGILRLRVGSRLGPVPGARVTAHNSAKAARAFRVSSELRGEDGLSLKLRSGARFFDRDVPPDARRASGVADQAGVVELQLLDGTPWTLQVEADGFAPQSRTVCVTASVLEQEVELEVGSKLIVDRGTFPLDVNIIAGLNSPFDRWEHRALLRRGEQQIEVAGVEPGVFTFEGISTEGVELALWSTECVVEPDKLNRFDLSLGGESTLEVDVIGATPAAPPHFAVVCGPLNSRGTPKWSRYAPVRGGFARFVALPPGPAVIKILTDNSEIGREWVTIKPGSELQRVAVGIPRGELRILHDESGEGSTRFELARRSQRFGSIGGWIAMGEPLARAGEVYYAGLDQGSYCLWAIEDGAAQRFEFQTLGNVVELDLRARSVELSSVRIELGPGIDPDGSLELELFPQQWVIVTAVDGVLALSHGAHRLRAPLSGIGYVTRSIEVPKDAQIFFDGPTSASLIEVRCDSVWMGTTVIVTPEGAAAPPQGSRSLSLYFDREGRGTIDLHSGAYVLTDRNGRRASMKVDPGVRSVLVRVP